MATNTQYERVTAVFDLQEDAEQAVSELRSSGIPDDHIGVISKASSDGQHEDSLGGIEKGAAGGGALGGALGLIAGVGTGFIPGAGPFIAAGVLTSWLGTVAGSAVSGAVVGGTAGAVGGALEERAGYSKGEAEYYGSRIENGGTLVAVDTSGQVQENDALAILHRHNGSTHISNA